MLNTLSMSKTFIAGLIIVIGLMQGCETPEPEGQETTPGASTTSTEIRAIPADRRVIVHLFEWKCTDGGLGVSAELAVGRSDPALGIVGQLVGDFGERLLDRPGSGARAAEPDDPPEALPDRLQFRQIFELAPVEVSGVIDIGLLHQAGQGHERRLAVVLRGYSLVEQTKLFRRLDRAVVIPIGGSQIRGQPVSWNRHPLPGIDEPEAWSP